MTGGEGRGGRGRTVVAVPLPRPPRLPRPLAALGAAGALAVAALVATAAPALAHDRLTSSTPGAGTTVANAPEAVSLGFSDEPLELGLQVVVTAPDGTAVSDGTPQVAGVDVVQGLADARPAGTYTVDWRVTSQDGHPIEGSYTFEAQNAVGPAATSPSPAPSSAAPSSAAPSATAEATATPSTTPASAESDPGPGVSGSTIGWTVAAGAAGALVGWLLVRARRRSSGS